jgi:hypothetical protein
MATSVEDRRDEYSLRCRLALIDANNLYFICFNCNSVADWLEPVAEFPRQLALRFHPGKCV